MYLLHIRVSTRMLLNIKMLVYTTIYGYENCLALCMEDIV